MKAKFKLMSCIAAAVALTTSIAAVAAEPAVYRDREEVLFEEAARARNTPEWHTAFEEALLEGKYPKDLVAATIYKSDTSDDNEILPAYLEPASSNSTNVRLTLVHDNDNDNGYFLWSGRFVVDDVNDFAATFTDPYSMDCKVLAGTSAELVYKKGYSVNFKTLSGYWHFSENGKIVTKSDYKDGTGTLKKLTNTYSSSGKLVEKAYYFYMNRGDERSAYYEVAVVHVVDKEYSQSAEYAAKPYANIIDSYTYVDTSAMGVMPAVSGGSENF